MRAELLDALVFVDGVLRAAANLVRRVGTHARYGVVRASVTRYELRAVHILRQKLLPFRAEFLRRDVAEVAARRVVALPALGHGVRLIYGGTPIQDVSVRDELTREQIIREFVAPRSGIDVLVANPAACAESISLHKTCSHAIYYDMSYNCAQYLQSLDRIHRVGGSEHKAAHYYFLQYEDTVDRDILANVQRKAQNMSAIIDQDYAIYSLDMFAEEEEVEAYERLFGKQSKSV